MDESGSDKIRINDLTDWGFERISATEFKHGKYFCVSLMSNFAIFSTIRYTEPISYEKLENFLIDNGYKKTTGQESNKETND